MKFQDFSIGIWSKWARFGETLQSIACTQGTGTNDPGSRSLFRWWCGKAHSNASSSEFCMLWCEGFAPQPGKARSKIHLCVPLYHWKRDRDPGSFVPVPRVDTFWTKYTIFKGCKPSSWQKMYHFPSKNQSFYTLKRPYLGQQILEIVGMSVFNTIDEPLCCRLYPDTTTLRNIVAQHILNKKVPFSRWIFRHHCSLKNSKIF